MIDATIVRVHQHATTVITRMNQGEESMGLSKGGRTTKIHALVDALGNSLEVILTEGNRHDVTQANPLLKGRESKNVIADKGYDSNELRNYLEASGRTPIIPPRAGRLDDIEYDSHTYRERNLVERFFAKIKHYRRVATRFEAKSYLYRAMIVLASIMIWLR